MKFYLTLVFCLCETLAITVHYETAIGSTKKATEPRGNLKDIRLVQLDVQAQPKSHQVFDSKREVIPVSEKIGNEHVQFKLRGDKKKYIAPRRNQMARVGQSLPPREDENHKIYMQKMADQLYIAQKHASLLSDYQKFIINQDPQVKNFVLAHITPSRTPKPFSSVKQGRRILPAQQIKTNEVEKIKATVTPATDSKGVVIVTPKTSVTPKVATSLRTDHSPQATDLKYVTLAPQTVAHYTGVHGGPQSVTYVPYYTPQPYTYYELGVTNKPQIETVQVPTTLSVGLASFASPQYHEDVATQVEDQQAGHPKYEFMYKVKDHQKNSHFGHMESRTDKATFGYYFVHLPDGRVETVKYWADKTGYHAKVDYQGEAKHPEPSEHNVTHP